MTLDPAEKFERMGERGTNWRDEYMRVERLCHKMKDQYSDVSRAIGVSCDDFGDPLDDHPTILARARACKAAYDGVREGVG